jgi:uncharacterized membrane protein (DUF2068 family)
MLLYVTDERLCIIGYGALVYAAIRFAEAWGLWRGRSWAGWLAVVSSAAYLPFEIVEFIKTQGWEVAVILIINLLIVALVASRLGKAQVRFPLSDP